MSRIVLVVLMYHCHKPIDLRKMWLCSAEIMSKKYDIENRVEIKCFTSFVIEGLEFQ
jgi:hypothetical protein